MLVLEDVWKAYRRGGPDILKGISLRADAGETVAIVGESGAGKSTLIRLLLALLRPDRGSYTFDGVDVSSLSRGGLRDWRMQVQPVFQDPLTALNPRLRIDTIVTEPLEAQGRLKGKRRAKAEELLARVGLPADHAGRYAHQLSGGQRQRVAIARAISTDPRMLLLDEPVSALDVSVRAQILNLLKDLNEEREMLTLYVTHDLATVSYLCDRSYVMYGGEFFEEAPSTTILKKAANPYTQMLVGSVPSINRKAGDGPEYADRNEQSRGCSFAPRCPFVMTKCWDVKSELHQIEPGWASRCHLSDPEGP